jgi:hypothetical protein
MTSPKVAAVLAAVEEVGGLSAEEVGELVAEISIAGLRKLLTGDES